MILNYQVSRSSPRERVKYLIEGLDGKRERVEVLDGDPELFVELAEKNPYSVKMHNFLISFAESREELMLKLMQQGKTVEELYEEIFSLLFPKEYYEREGLNILAVAHGDTDNYHIHLTVENYDYTNGKSLYVPRTKTELEFYRALEKYISAKYGLSFSVRPISTGKAGVEKVKKILEERKSYKSKTKDEVKEEITNHLVKLALTGEIRSREELIAIYCLSHFIVFITIFKKLCCLRNNFFSICAYKFGSSSSYSFGSLCNISHDKHWFPQRRSFFLNPPRIRQHKI